MSHVFSLPVFTYDDIMNDLMYDLIGYIISYDVFMMSRTELLVFTEDNQVFLYYDQSLYKSSFLQRISLSFFPSQAFREAVQRRLHYQYTELTSDLSSLRNCESSTPQKNFNST